MRIWTNVAQRKLFNKIVWWYNINKSENSQKCVKET